MRCLLVTSRERQRLETAATVLAAADTLFLTRGFTQTKIREVAEACGVSVGTVMAVGDKDALLVAVLDDRIRQIHTQRSESQTLNDALDHIESISRQLEPFVTLFTSHPTLARAYASILVGGKHNSVVFKELAALLIQEIAAILIASGRTTEQRATAIAEAVYFAYIGRLFTWPTDADDDADRLRHELRRIIAIISTDEGFPS